MDLISTFIAIVALGMFLWIAQIVIPHTHASLDMISILIVLVVVGAILYGSGMLSLGLHR